MKRRRWFDSIFGFFRASPMTEDDLAQAEGNSRRIVEILGHNGKPMREYTEADHLFLGRFLALALLLENAIDEAISPAVIDCKNQMLGRKIDTLKAVLKELRKHGEDTADWDQLIAPLREFSKIRGKIAHNIKKKNFDPKELSLTKAYVKKRRPNLFEPIEESQITPREKDLAHISSFIWCVMELLSLLQHRLE
ncbi:MAG: hypothetical protein AB7F43_07735 [Bacteriovoracia bacterium]